MRNITIDGKKYDPEKLPPEAKRQLHALVVTEQEIKRLKIQTAIAQTALSSYAKALQEILAK